MADERDYSKIERNMQKLLEGGASQQEMDTYLQSEGLTVEQFRDRPRPETFIPESAAPAPPSEIKQPPPPEVPTAEVQAPDLALPPERPSESGTPRRPTLAGDSLSRPLHLILPYPGAITLVPSRYTQEQWNRRLQVAGVARSLEEGTEFRPPAPIGATDIASSASIFGFRPQIRGIGGMIGEGLARWLRPDRMEIDASVPLSEVYGLYRDAERMRQDAWSQQHPAGSLGLSLLGGVAGTVPRLGGIPLPRGFQGPPAPRPPGVPTTTSEQLAVASGYGAVGGGLQGAAEHPEDTLAGAGRGAVGGSMLGPTAYLGLRGVGSLLGRLRPRRGIDPRERAALWDELGVPPPPLATLPSGPRRVADYLTRTPMGQSLQRTTGEGAARLQQSLDDALRFGGAPRTISAAGEEAQELIRRGVSSRRPHEELMAMTPAERQAISGVEPLPSVRRTGQPEALPTIEPAASTIPREAAELVSRARSQHLEMEAELRAAREAYETAQQAMINHGRDSWSALMPYRRAIDEAREAVNRRVRLLQAAEREVREAEEAARRITEQARASADAASAEVARRRIESIQRRLQEETAEGARPTGLPRSQESYTTQLAAGELALAEVAPPVQGRLLGRRGETHTALWDELDAIALEARQQLRLPGYESSRLFSPENETLFPGLVQLLRTELRGAEGRRVVDFLERLAAQRRFGGEFPQGLTGTDLILANLRTLRERGGVNVSLLDRLINAIERDVTRLAGNTPAGQHWLQQRANLRAARARMEQELQEPLQRVTGNANPAAALQTLQQALRAGGDIRVLRAFLQLAADKGDRTNAVSLLLTGIRGRNLQEFVHNWRALTPEARNLMFQGSMQALGTRLERFAQAYEHIIRAPTQMRVRDLPRMRNVLQGVWAYLDMPTAVGSVVGQLALDRLLSSRLFQNWMLRVPLELGPGRQWQNHLGLLSGVIASSGLEQETGRRVLEVISGLLSSAGAETPPPTTPPTAPPTTPRKGANQTEETSTTEFTELPPWHRAVAGVESESVFDRHPLGPDPGVLAEGLRRGRRPPQLGEAIPTAGDIIRREFAQYLPRGSTEMVARVLDHPLNPLGAAFQGGRMMAEGIDTSSPGLAALGAFFASPPGMGLGTFIGLPGARRLALSGRGNAQVMLQLASTMESRGATVPEIQSVVSRRLAALGDTDFGTVTRLPDGQWAIELANVPARHGRLNPYEVRPLHEVRPDPMLFGAHPELRDIPVWYNPDLAEHGLLGLAQPGRVALYRPPAGLGMPRILEHEIQHMTSVANRFPGGATLQAYEPGGALAHLRPEGMTARQAYEATTDEWLAREAAERLYWPVETRREIPATPPGGLITHYWEDVPAGARRLDQDPWTPFLDNRLRQLRAEGRSNQEIAQELGRSVSAIQGRVNQLGLGPGVITPSAMTPEVVARMRALIAEGQSVGAAARAVGVSPDVAWGFIARRGREQLGVAPSRPRVPRIFTMEELRSRGWATEGSLDLPRNREIIERLIAGETGSALAREYGVSRQRVSQLLTLYRAREAREAAVGEGREAVEEAAQISRLVQQRIAVEDALRRQGKSPAEIARELNLRFQEGVSAEEIQAGTVWWREAEAGG